VYWDKATVTEIFKGSIERDGRLTVYERESSVGGVYSMTMKEGELSGTWTRKKDNETKSCYLKKASKLIIPRIRPVDFMGMIFDNITRYASTQVDQYLNNVYNSWHTPERSLKKTFKDYIKDFSHTFSDSLVSANADNFSAYCFVNVVHDATDFDSEFVNLTTIRYNTRYTLINVNSMWKILEYKLISQDTVDKNYNISGRNSYVQINEVNPNTADIGDTAEIKISSDFNTMEVDKLKVFIGGSEANVLERTPRLFKVIVPDLKDINNSVIVFKYKDKEFPEFNQFKIKPKESKGIPWYYYAIGFLVLSLFTIFVIRRNQNLAREKERLSQTTSLLTEEKNKLSAANEELLFNISNKPDSGAVKKIQLPQPAVPQELIDACKRRECVLYTGAEIAVQAGFPEWNSFVFDLLNWSVENKYIEDESLIDSLKTSLDSGNINRTADSIIFSLEKRNVNLNEYLNKIFIQPKPEIPGIYKVIKSTNYSAILSTTYDQTIERTYDSQIEVLTYNDIEKLQEAVSNNSLFLLKIFGDIPKQETVLISPSRFDDEMLRNLQFSQFIETLFYSRSVLFIGEDFEGIESFFNSVKFRGFRSRPHYALVGVKTYGWKTAAQVMEEKFGIKVIPYEHGNNDQLAKFMSELSISAPNTQAGVNEKKYTLIKKLTLKNIGPFENLELTFDKNWNILLGDNGVGKSTILKAIATVICGSDASSYAYRLIKSGQNDATIILETEDIFDNSNENESYDGKQKAYIAKIFKTGRDKAEIERYVRPLDAENWLVLAFPPLRTVSWIRPAGPQPDGSKISVSEDMLPIIAGETDPRMDKLKQWVVNQYFKSTDKNKSDEEKNIYKKQLDRFAQIIDDLTPNLLVKDLEINTDTFEVSITTEDGKIPIEAISQGTLSLISWVGILMQRLYEVFGEEDDPLLQHAKVIMDEVDAHMHPQWQQTLIYNLKKVFPNVQFIVSTHSPFVVGGMNPEQVFKFARNEEGKIVRIEVSAEDTHGRIDQIVTGPLFDLEYGRDNETKILLKRYSELSTKLELTGEEEKELENLSIKLNKTLLLPHEKKEARNVFEMIQESLVEKLKTMDKTQKEKILKEMEIQVQEGLTKFKK
jgi:energy-coupling factor transporter ATP-binding protein EcfA2